MNVGRGGRELIGDGCERKIVSGRDADGARVSSARTMPSAPIARSCELVPCSSSSSRKRAGGGSSRICLMRRISAMKRDWPSSSESVVLDGSADREAREGETPARTGAPASASIALTPTARSRVLLPDMFEPLTTSNCKGAASRTLFGTERSSGSSGWLTLSASNSGVAV